MSKRKIISNQNSPSIPKKVLKMPNSESFINEAKEFLLQLNHLDDQFPVKAPAIRIIENLMNHVVCLDQILEAKQETIIAKEEIINGRDKLLAAKEDIILNIKENQASIMEMAKAPLIREHRRAIVIKNLPESSKPTMEAIMKEDEEQVKNLISATGAYAQVVSCYRMGKKMDEKQKPLVRLMKVQLQTSSQARDIILNAKNLKGITNYSGISLRKSMTNQERQHVSQKFAMMKERIEELKIENPGMKYVIYADKICMKQLDGSKPIPVPNERLNVQLSGGNAVTIESRNDEQIDEDMF